jgi:hypothetical protein
MNIGRELKEHYELPPDLPHQIRALLFELDERCRVRI